MRLSLARRKIKYGVSPKDLELESEFGAVHPIRIKEQLADFTGNGAQTFTLSGFIPDGALVFGITSYVVEEVVAGGDRTTFNLGDAGTGAQYGTAAMTSQKYAKGGALDMKSSSLTGPKLYTAANDIIFSVTGGTTGNLTGGKVRVSMAYMLSTAPSR